MVCALLRLSYLTQDDIFKFHPFACEFHEVPVFNGWLVFHCLTIINMAAMNIVEHVS